MKAVIQAGGKGTRLRPYTLVLPKPLMPVGGGPVIEMLIKWLRRNGVEEAYVTTGYLGHLIQAVCGDGAQWDMRIQYSEEPEPLGTVGALRLVQDRLRETFLMLNGDIIADLDLRAFRQSHAESGAMVTVAVARKGVRVDLGVIESRGGYVTGFREKPTLEYLVSMGVYCMQPAVIDLIPRGVPFGFDDLMHLMLEREHPIHIYEHHGIWMDIGRPDDYREAQRLLEENQGLFGGDV